MGSTYGTPGTAEFHIEKKRKSPSVRKIKANISKVRRVPLFIGYCGLFLLGIPYDICVPKTPAAKSAAAMPNIK
jgi:hypothetical protein